MLCSQAKSGMSQQKGLAKQQNREGSEGGKLAARKSMEVGHRFLVAGHAEDRE